MRRIPQFVHVAILLFIALAAITLVAPQPAAAGTNGQMVEVVASRAAFTNVSVSGFNQNGHWVTWRWSGFSGNVVTWNWWWKGNVVIDARLESGQWVRCGVNVPVWYWSNIIRVSCP